MFIFYVLRITFLTINLFCFRFFFHSFFTVDGKFAQFDDQGEHCSADNIPENRKPDITYDAPTNFAEKIEVEHIRHRMIKAAEGEEDDGEHNADRRA